MKPKKWLIIAVMLALLFVPIFSAIAQGDITNIYHPTQDLSSSQGHIKGSRFGGYTLLQSIIASGGNLRSSTNYIVNDSLGEPIANASFTMQGRNYQLTSGLWANAPFGATATPISTLTATNTPPPSTPNATSVTLSPTVTSATHTPTETPTATSVALSPTATPTTTNTPPPSTPSATSVTLSPTPIPSDSYEPNDSCDQAKSILTDGTVQMHAFELKRDKDWIVFEGKANTSYLIEAQTPPDSLADVVFELYDRCEDDPTLPIAGQDYTFSPDVRLEFKAINDGPLYLKLLNKTSSVAGPNVTYNLSIRVLNEEPQPGALVVVAGRLRNNDPLQSNIYHVTDEVVNVFQRQGYGKDRIYYLAPEMRAGVNALATVDHLQAAITEWAPQRVGPDRAFTLYLMDHGNDDTLYLDEQGGERVSPAQIDEWLNELEAERPGVRVNIIYEACYSGSFIEPPQTISAPGRVVIASTGAQQLAWASDDGAIFSDHFLAALSQGQSLLGSFESARAAVQIAYPAQTPWLEDEGDGQANEANEGLEAARRGFTIAGTFGDELWQPYIVQGNVPTDISGGEGQIWAQVRDDQNVRRVWAVIYPPSYQPPTEREELVQEEEVVPTLFLRDQGNNQYAATFTGFDEPGTYRIVIYAEDDGGIEARPLSFSVQTGGQQLYLPIMIR